VASASGQKGMNNVKWESAETARFIKLEAKEKADHAWSMKSLTLFAR
jgi:hypothetical protein